MNTSHPMRGTTAIVGIGQTPYYKRGTSPDPEPKLALRAIVAACEDAGIDPSEIDGFVSYGSEHNTGQKLMPALGTKSMRFAALAWTHGGGIPAAVGIAAQAIHSGQAEVVVVYRAMAEDNNQRLQVAVTQGDTPAQYLVNGIDMVLQRSAQRSQRLIEHEGVPRSTLEAIARAGYHHAQNNPGAAGHGLQVDHAKVRRPSPFAATSAAGKGQLAALQREPERLVRAYTALDPCNRTQTASPRSCRRTL